MAVVTDSKKRLENISIEQQERAEFNFVRLIIQANNDARRNGAGRQDLITNAQLASIRKAWGKDLSQELFMRSDIKKISDLLPETPHFEGFKKSLTQPKILATLSKQWRAMYDAYVDSGVHPNVTYDDSIVSSGVIPSDYRGPLIFSKGGSLRDDAFDGTLLDSKMNVVATVQNGVVEKEQTEQIDIEAVETDYIIGWSGQGDVVGLSSLIGAYISKADRDLIESKGLIDPDLKIPINQAYKTVELVKRLRSEGVLFTVNDRNRKGKANQLEVNIPGSEKLVMRVFDLENNGQYMGRLYGDHATYFADVVNSNSKNYDAWTLDDAMMAINYVRGLQSGTIEKLGKFGQASKGNSNATAFGGKASPKYNSFVRLGGASAPTALKVMHHADRYSSMTFDPNDPASVEGFLRDVIEDARSHTRHELNFETISERVRENAERINAGDDPLSYNDLFSVTDLALRDVQDELVEDLELLHGVAGDISVLNGVTLQSSGLVVSENSTLEALNEQMVEAIIDTHVGTFESGFNADFAVNASRIGKRSNMREAVNVALKAIDYDIDKIHGNEFGNRVLKDKMVKFDPTTARKLKDVTHPLERLALERVEQTLNQLGVYPKGPIADVAIDDNGVIRWSGERQTRSNEKGTKRKIREYVSGEIGQVFTPDENGIIKTKHLGGSNYGFIPGYIGYFSYDLDTPNRMDRFRVKGYEQELLESIDGVLRRQVTQPYMVELGNIAQGLDSSSLNRLYHGKVYGTRVPLDFVENSQHRPDVTQAILKSLRNRVRFDNVYGEFATTSADTFAKRGAMNKDNKQESEFSVYKAVGERNMRMLDSDMTNIADLDLTGNATNQGLVWYLTDGSKVDSKTGTVTPSEGMYDENGQLVPDKTAVLKLDYFKHAPETAWDRVLMSSMQLMDAPKVDESTNVALMNFYGWTFDDSYAVSQAFADRNKVFGTESNPECEAILMDVLEGMHNGSLRTYDEAVSFVKDVDPSMHWSEERLLKGLEAYKSSVDNDEHDLLREFLEEQARFRPLQRGDKVSDFGGNKGTIGIVVDGQWSEEEAIERNLLKEWRVMNANPHVDVFGAPYSPLSRFNGGIINELKEGERFDIYNPETGETMKNAGSSMNFIVTHLTVDSKTHAYTQEDLAEGKGRKASGQLAWGLASAGCHEIIKELYGDNDKAWEALREYLIVTGLDLAADGTVLPEYTPHEGEFRNHFTYDPDVSADQFLFNIGNAGGFLDLPFDVTFRSGREVSEIPVLSASLRKDMELVDGSMSVNDHTNRYVNIYKGLERYHQASNDAEKEQAKRLVQGAYSEIENDIIKRRLEGGHNGKHNFIRDNIMGNRLHNSATGVAIVDPRLDIGQASMNSKMMAALDVKEGDTVIGWRDPVLRDGAIRTFTVVQDETVHGIGVNPISDKSHDMDFDGDSMGLKKLSTKAATKEAIEKLSHYNHMFDVGSGKDDALYFNMGLDIATSTAVAAEKGDTSAAEMLDDVISKGHSADVRVRKQAQKLLSAYSHKMFNEHGFAGDWVDFTDNESIEASFAKMVEHNAKGSEKSLGVLMSYIDGNATRQDAQGIQRATGVKTDVTGVGGGYSQKLVSLMRDMGIKSALEMTYPITQGVLQIKHDPHRADEINDILSGPMRNLYNGKSADGKTKNVTPTRFKREMTQLLKEDLGVDFNTDCLDDVANALTRDNRIQSINELVTTKASPLDRLAYSGKFSTYTELAKEQANLMSGEFSSLFASKKMRENDGSYGLYKKDTQDKAFLTSLRESISGAVRGATQSLDKTTTANADTGYVFE